MKGGISMFIRNHNTSLEQMKSELAETKLRMDTMQNYFQNAVDPDLIDCYIFETNAAWKKYHYLIKEMRQLTTNL